MPEILQAKAKELLLKNEVSLIIGYQENRGRTSRILTEKAVSPVFITRVDEVRSLVFNVHCTYNLSTYLTRKEIKDCGKVAVMAKGCDTKSIQLLISENQLKRENLIIIGLICRGVVEKYGLKKDEKCSSCRLTTPSLYDILIDQTEEEIKDSDQYQPKEGRIGKVEEKIDQLDKMSPKDRWLYWIDQFKRCTRCYACRNACPLCYCEQCIVEKDTPQWIEKSASLPANLSFHLMRAFHLTGRCIDCRQCERACPMDLPLTLLHRKMQKLKNEV